MSDYVIIAGTPRSGDASCQQYLHPVSGGISGLYHNSDRSAVQGVCCPQWLIQLFYSPLVSLHYYHYKA